MRFAQFYHNSTGYVSGSIPPKFSPDHIKPIPACGSDSVAILDGRYSIARCASEARALARKRGYIGFTLEAGESFTRARVVRPLELI
jgi:hypothetical protein